MCYPASLQQQRGDESDPVGVDGGGRAGVPRGRGPRLGAPRAAGRGARGPGGLLLRRAAGAAARRHALQGPLHVRARRQARPARGDCTLCSTVNLYTLELTILSAYI